jgi:hypothetical protein
MRLELLTNQQLAEYLGAEEQALLEAESLADWHRSRADRARQMLFARMAGTGSPLERSEVLTRFLSPDPKIVQLELL